MTAVSHHSKIVLGICLLAFFNGAFAGQKKPVDWVDPFIGTGGHGHTYPGASLPHGMVQLSPDTDTDGWDWCSGYHDSDSSIIGFSHTHLSGTGCADYGDILFMPTTGVLRTEPGEKGKPRSGYRSRFSHRNEKAEPGYYSVWLDDYGIKAELTVTRRTGFHKYVFPKSTDAHILIDLDHGIGDKTKDAEIHIVDKNTIEGYRRSTGWATNHCVYFRAEFSRPFSSFGIAHGDTVATNTNSARGSTLKAFVNYSTSAGEIVYVKVGISHTSLEGARSNLSQELPDWKFDRVRRKARETWDTSLTTLSIKTRNTQNKKIFYTSLYHALLNPNVLSDVDGSYVGMDGSTHHVKNGDMYTVFSLWDTFRAEHPLFTIIEKKRACDMVQSLVSKYEEQGLLPVWELASNETGTMIGYHAVPVIVDAYMKGIKGFDAAKAFEAMKKSAMQDRLGLDYYREMGYIPSDLENESVSKTLEYAYDDWCIAAMAKALGKIEDYKTFIERAKFYSNVFDPTTSLMRPKKNGKWVSPFDPYSVSGDYTEANSWQYSFFVPQDVTGLIRLMGGDNKYIAKLDELFTTQPTLSGRFQSDITGLIGQYAHGNEPSHHMAYLHNYAGAPWKTEQRVHEILSTLYTARPDGLCGNEDCGQMSAWYVLSALGFYPVCPGDTTYVIGTPLFDEATITTAGAKRFTVIARNVSDKNFYIQSATLNGKVHPQSFITHGDLERGGILVLEMGPTPSSWGTDKASRPVSSIDIPFVPTPYLTSGERVFRDTSVVSISSLDTAAQILFTTDGSDPRSGKTLYTHSFTVDSSTQVKAVSRVNGLFSKVVSTFFTRVPEGRSVRLKTAYSHSYSGGGALGLIDGVKGTTNFHTDAWQGYEGVDCDAIIDLGTSQKLSSITASFLQDSRSWIFYPSVIEYQISTDGVAFRTVYSVENASSEANSVSGIKEFGASLAGTEARYVRVYAKNVGLCPPWHLAAGGKAWLFIDEVTIR